MNEVIIITIIINYFYYDITAQDTVAFVSVIDGYSLNTYVKKPQEGNIQFLYISFCNTDKCIVNSCVH